MADTNCLVSAALAIIRGDGADHSPTVAILFAMRDGLVVNLTTTALIYELAETLQLPRLEVPIDFTVSFVDVVTALSEFVPIRGLGCRDDDDDRLVETAVNGRAHVLVSRDKDLLNDVWICRVIEKRACQSCQATISPTGYARSNHRSSNPSVHI